MMRQHSRFNFSTRKKLRIRCRPFSQIFQLSDLTVKEAKKSKTGATSDAEKGIPKIHGVTVKTHTVFPESEIAPGPNEEEAGDPRPDRSGTAFH